MRSVRLDRNRDRKARKTKKMFGEYDFARPTKQPVSRLFPTKETKRWSGVRVERDVHTRSHRRPVDIIRYNVAPSDIICSRAVNSTPVSINLDSISTKRGFMFSAPRRGRRALSYPVEPVFGELVSFPQPLLFSLFLFIVLTSVFYRLVCRKRKIYKHICTS